MDIFEGFNGKPESWSGWWIAMWTVTTPVWIAVNLVLDEWIWRIGSFLVLFLVAEMVSITRQKDPYPPLTHAVRHFLPNWLAFPLIYWTAGSISTRWLGLPWSTAWRVGVLMGILGWLTDHFTVTYRGDDPYPFNPPPGPPADAPAVDDKPRAV